MRAWDIARRHTHKVRSLLVFPWFWGPGLGTVNVQDFAWSPHCLPPHHLREPQRQRFYPATAPTYANPNLPRSGFDTKSVNPYYVISINIMYTYVLGTASFLVHLGARVSPGSSRRFLAMSSSNSRRSMPSWRCGEKPLNLFA